MVEYTELIYIKKQGWGKSGAGASKIEASLDGFKRQLCKVITFTNFGSTRLTIIQPRELN